MKKIFVLLTILTLTVVSCKNETKSDVSNEVTDTTAVVTDSLTADSVVVDSVVVVDPTNSVEEVK